MKCPVCKDVNLQMSERQGVEIDYCPTCRGVWLDRNELDKIIEKSLANDQGVSGYNSMQHQEERKKYKNDYDYHNSDYYKKRKKKSKMGMLLDLFD